MGITVFVNGDNKIGHCWTWDFRQTVRGKYLCAKVSETLLRDQGEGRLSQVFTLQSGLCVLS